MKSVICVLLVVLALCGCSKALVPDIKKHAVETWATNGFEVVGYEGYEYTSFGRFGGCVWYIVKRGTTTYHGCISRWEDEYHIYNLSALDAVKGN